MLFQRRDKCEKPRFKNFAALDLFWDVSLAQPELLLTKVLQSLRDRKSEKTAYRKALQHYLESMETEIIVDISYLQSMHHSFTVFLHSRDTWSIGSGLAHACQSSRYSARWACKTTCEITACWLASWISCHVTSTNHSNRLVSISDRQTCSKWTKCITTQCNYEKHCCQYVWQNHAYKTMPLILFKKCSFTESYLLIVNTRLHSREYFGILLQFPMSKERFQDSRDWRASRWPSLQTLAVKSRM